LKELKDNYPQEINIRDKQIDNLRTEVETLTIKVEKLEKTLVDKEKNKEKLNINTNAIKEAEDMNKADKNYMEELKKTQISKDLEINELTKKIETKENVNLII